MNRHLVRLLLMLYPRSWRDRYGPEVVRLTQELIAVGETTPARGALNMAGAAVQLKTGRVWCVIPVPGPVSSGP
jgi:hypothetical protein